MVFRYFQDAIKAVLLDGKCEIIGPVASYQVLEGWGHKDGMVKFLDGEARGFSPGCDANTVNNMRLHFGNLPFESEAEINA